MPQAKKKAKKKVKAVKSSVKVVEEAPQGPLDRLEELLAEMVKETPLSEIPALAVDLKRTFRRASQAATRKLRDARRS